MYLGANSRCVPLKAFLRISKIENSFLGLYGKINCILNQFVSFMYMLEYDVTAV